MALGILLMMFVAMSTVSILGLSLLVLVKNGTAKRRIFYVLSVWGMFIGVFFSSSLPSNYIAQRCVVLCIGLLSAAGLLIHFRARRDSMRFAAYGLTAASVILGILKLYL